MVIHKIIVFNTSPVLTVKPRELFSSNVDLAWAEFRVSFRNSNAGGFMKMRYGFNWGVRNIRKAWNNIMYKVEVCNLSQATQKILVGSKIPIRTHFV